MTKTKRKRVIDFEKEFAPDEFDTVAKMRKWLEKYNFSEDATIEQDGWYDDECRGFNITSYRDETDAEVDKREAAAKRRRASARKAAANRKRMVEAAERKQYELLKQKFEEV